MERNVNMTRRWQRRLFVISLLVFVAISAAGYCYDCDDHGRVISFYTENPVCYTCCPQWASWEEVRYERIEKWCVEGGSSYYEFCYMGSLISCSCGA